MRPASLMTGALFAAALSAPTALHAAPHGESATTADETPLFAGAHQRLWRDGVEVRLSTDAKRIRLSEVLHLRLEVRTPPGGIARTPHVGERLAGFRVVDRRPFDPVLTDDQPRTWLREYRLEPVEAGVFEVPVLRIGIAESDERMSNFCRYSRDCAVRRGSTRIAFHLETAPFEVSVTTGLPPEASIHSPRDIAGPVALAGGLAPTRWTPFVAGALVLALLGLAAWHNARAPAGNASAAGQRPFDSLAALDALRGGPGESPRVAYERLVRWLRAACAAALNEDTAARTSEELHADLAGRLERHVLADAEALLARCDAARFAPPLPDIDSIDADYARAARLGRALLPKNED